MLTNKIIKNKDKGFSFRYLAEKSEKILFKILNKKNIKKFNEEYFNILLENISDAKRDEFQKAWIVAKKLLNKNWYKKILIFTIFLLQLELML